MDPKRALPPDVPKRPPLEAPLEAGVPKEKLGFDMVLSVMDRKVG